MIDRKLLAILSIFVLIILGLVFFISPIAKFTESVQGINEDLGTIEIRNHGFEIVNDAANTLDNTLPLDVNSVASSAKDWDFIANDPALKNSLSTEWSPEGSYSIRIYGTQIVERDDYVSLTQLLFIPNDAVAITGSLKITIPSDRPGGYRLLLCKVDDTTVTGVLDNGDCISDPSVVSGPYIDAGEYRLNLPIPRDFNGKYARIYLRTYYSASDLIDGSWDDIKLVRSSV